LRQGEIFNCQASRLAIGQPCDHQPERLAYGRAHANDFCVWLYRGGRCGFVLYDPLDHRVKKASLCQAQSGIIGSRWTIEHFKRRVRDIG
jgi:hypothetical protein